MNKNERKLGMVEPELGSLALNESVFIGSKMYLYL